MTRLNRSAAATRYALTQPTAPWFFKLTRGRHPRQKPFPPSAEDQSPDCASEPSPPLRFLYIRHEQADNPPAPRNLRVEYIERQRQN